MINTLPFGFTFFENIINEHFLKNYNNIIKFIEEQPEDNILINAEIYNMKQKINYKNLKKRVINLYKYIVEKNKL